MGSCPTCFGKDMVSLPEGLWVPFNTLAMAIPALEPRCHVSTIAGMCSFSQVNVIGRPFIKTKTIFESDDKRTEDDDYSVKRENDELFDVAPERDLREPQPTISVNYRVIKNNGENELKNSNQAIKSSKYDDDWNNNESEW